MRLALFTLLLFPVFYSAQTVVIWEEDFGSGCDAGMLATDYVSAASSWTEFIDGTNSATANQWYLSAAENGNAPGQCGSGCGNDRTLHIGSDPGILGDIGAAYFEGIAGFCDILDCGATSKRIQSPTINCSGLTDITLQFDYIEGGNAQDNATLWYFDGASWNQLADMAKTSNSCSPQGTWTHYSIALPPSAANNLNVKIGFRWVNNDDAVASDPSVAIDDIILTGQSNGSDITPPGITCVATQTLACIELPDYTLDAIATDDVDLNPTIAQEPAAGVLITSNTSVTLTATDDAGNSSYCTFQVILDDSEAPVIICPPNKQVIANSSGIVTLTVTDLGTVSASDNCSVVSITNNHPSEQFTVGETLVIWTAQDAAGNTTTCEQVVTIIADEPPIVICPGSAMPNMTTPDCTPSWSTGSADDQIDDVILKDFDANVLMSNMNSGSNEQPTSYIEYAPVPGVTSCAVISGNAYVLDLGTGDGFNEYIAVWFDRNNDGDFMDLGEFVGHNTIASTTISFNLYINMDVIYGPHRLRVMADFSAPLGSSDYCNVGTWGECEDYLILVNPPATNVFCGIMPDCTHLVNVYDDFDPSPSITQSPVPGTFITEDTEIIMTITDSGGNVVTCSFMIYYGDVTPPVITCPNDLNLSTDETACIATVTVDLLGTVEASDNCGLDNVIHDWDYGPAPIGDTYVTWTAFDVQGNSSTCTQQIHVEDLIAPIIICPEPMNFVIPDGALVAEVIMGIPQVMDNCGGVSITNNITESDNASGNYPIGNTDVVFTALDDAGNVSTCISSVDVSVQTVTCCPGDFNCDGYVSVLDLIILINEFGCISGCAASLDGNTTTTVSDLEIFVGLYGTVCPE